MNIENIGECKIIFEEKKYDSIEKLKTAILESKLNANTIILGNGSGNDEHYQAVKDAM